MDSSVDSHRRHFPTGCDHASEIKIPEVCTLAIVNIMQTHTNGFVQPPELKGSIVAKLTLEYFPFQGGGRELCEAVAKL